MTVLRALFASLGLLARCRRGAITLTAMQFFIGSLTIGIAAFRGTEAYEGFHYESQLEHANFASLKVAADHARSANAIASNNVIEAGLMGPRMSTEAGMMTMIVNGAVACASAYWNMPMMKLCQEFNTNFPRMMKKVVFARLKQTMIWGALDKLSTAMDKVAAMKAIEFVDMTMRMLDSSSSVRVDDPSMQSTPWGTDIIADACDLAMKDAVMSLMPDMPFPEGGGAFMMHMNLFQGMPKALTAMMPKMLCGGASKGGGGGGKGGGGGGGSSASKDGKPHPVKLGMIPSVSKEASETCAKLERQMRAEIAAQQVFSEDVAKFATCGADAQAKAHPMGADGTEVAGTLCSFDQNKCYDDKLEDSSGNFLQSVGLPKDSSTSASSLGGSPRAPTDSDWNSSEKMRACSVASKPIANPIVKINDATRKVMSFGRAEPSTALRQAYEYKACAKWYFPDAKGPYASIPHDEQPFVSAWKPAFVKLGN